MRVLTRKKNESIIINDDITVVVVEIRGDKVRLAIEAPKEASVHRNEVYEAIRRNQNLEPSSSSVVSANAAVRPSTTTPNKNRKDSILEFRELLLGRRNALRKALAGDLSLLKQLLQAGGDVFDATSDEAQHEISSQLGEVVSRELVNIERAIIRIENGTYGDCEGCGQRIPLRRLNALPYATTCFECQRAAEV